jgi:large subunit ribosomal protein L25
VHDISIHPVKGQILHVDFYTVNMKEKLQTEIPLEFIGESAAVTEEDGTLITVKTEVNVECLPQDLVHSIQVDISSLATFDDSIRIEDIKVPAGIVILDEPEEVVASVTPPRSEEEMAELEEVPDATIDVESETQSGTDAAPGDETDADSEEKEK